MTTQLELKPFQAAPEDPNVRWLEALLLEAKDWRSATDIVISSGGQLKERSVRVLASASKWILSGPGSPGYKHVQHSTPDEIKHYTNATISQGRNMVKRAIRIRRSAHEIFG